MNERKKRIYEENQANINIGLIMEQLAGNSLQYSKGIRSQLIQL